MNNLENGGKLTLNQSLVSGDEKYKLVLQGSDGNLVLYEGSKVLWSPNIQDRGAKEAIMQGDGNFVVYNNSGEAIFASNTDGNKGAFLIITDEGTIIINNGFKVIWQKP